MKIVLLCVMMSILGFSACHEEPVAPPIPAGMPARVLSLDLPVKNAGVEGIREGARLTGTVAYCLTCMVDVDHYEERVADYRLTLDTDLALNAESDSEILPGSWFVVAESIDNFQIKKGELRKLRKAYPLEDIGPDVTLFIEYDATETGVKGSRAWIAQGD